MFGFFTAGIAAVIFEFLEKRKTIKIKSDHRKHILPYLILVFAYLFLEFVFPFYTIYNLIFSLLLASLIIALIRKDLIKQIIFSGIFFSVVYLLLFLLFNKIFPSYIEKVYSLENFLGADLLGVPLEEVLFAFAVGACWSTLYEFIKGYKTVKLKK